MAAPIIQTLDKLGPQRQHLSKLYVKKGRLRVFGNDGVALALVDYYDSGNFYVAHASGASESVHNWADLKKRLIAAYPGALFKHD